ncbi:hypothetical protein Tco_1335205 [Tanacetum coccineum]
MNLFHSWYQSKSGRHLRSRQQLYAIQREIRRGNEAHLGTCMRKISRDCKEMLKKKLEEIRGHILKFCPTNNKSNGKNADKDSSENTKESEEDVKPANPTVVLKYPESIHFSTTYMIKGTDHGTWGDICKVLKSSYVPLFNILKKFDGNSVTEVMRPRIARMKYRVTRLS